MTIQVWRKMAAISEDKWPNIYLWFAFNLTGIKKSALDLHLYRNSTTVVEVVT